MKYKRMGIIGSVCIITRIGAVRIPSALEEPNYDEPGNFYTYYILILFYLRFYFDIIYLYWYS